MIACICEQLLKSFREMTECGACLKALKPKQSAEDTKMVQNGFDMFPVVSSPRVASGSFTWWFKPPSGQRHYVDGESLMVLGHTRSVVSETALENKNKPFLLLFILYNTIPIL